jgi:hypothetical protein
LDAKCAKKNEKAKKRVPFPIKFQLIHKAKEREMNAKRQNAHFAIHYSSSDAWEGAKESAQNPFHGLFLLNSSQLFFSPLTFFCRGRPRLCWCERDRVARSILGWRLMEDGEKIK